jgi:uncharacterized protein
MILYLHGFRSGPQSQKVQELSKRLAQRGLAETLWCEQLSPVPIEAVAQAEAAILAARAKGLTPTLFGSSLGGFYATHLAEKHGLRALLINPLVLHGGMDPAAFIGEHQMIYSPERFCFTAEHVAQIAALAVPRLTQAGLMWLLAETGDEVLDWREAVRFYAGARQTVLPGGDHGFSRWPDYLDVAIKFAGLNVAA